MKGPQHILGINIKHIFQGVLLKNSSMSFCTPVTAKMSNFIEVDD